MLDEPQDAQAQRITDGEPSSEGLANTPNDTAAGTVKPQDGPMERPGTEAEDEGGEPMTNEPLPVADDGPGVGLQQSDEETIDGNRGM